MPDIITVTVNSDPAQGLLTFEDPTQAALAIAAQTEAQVIQWNLSQSPQPGTFNPITAPPQEHSGFAWTDASQEAQQDPFSAAVRINDNQSILLVDFHVDNETQSNISYQLSAIVDGTVCVTNPQPAKGLGRQGDPCIQNQ